MAELAASAVGGPSTADAVSPGTVGGGAAGFAPDELDELSRGREPSARSPRGSATSIHAQGDQVLICG
jgi:hypothetical protein